MDRFDEMAVFIAVAERGSFGSAARQLGQSAPTVTRAVLALEERLGTLLLARTTRKVRLTDAGARFLEDSRRVLSELSELEDAGIADPTQLRGLITLTAPQMFGRRYVLPLVRDFLVRHPAIRAKLVLRDDLLNLHDEGIDVAVRVGSPRSDSPEGTSVGSVRRVLVAAPELLGQQGVPQHPSELTGYPLIACSIDAGAPEWTFPQGGGFIRVPLNPILRISTPDAAIDAAKSGLGITRVMSYQVADSLASGALCLVLQEYEPPPLPVRVIVSHEKKPIPRVARFVTHAVTALQSHPGLN